MSGSLTVYRAGMAALSPLLPLYLKRRASAGKEDPARLSERFGKTDTPRPDGPLVWLHAASVGESIMLLPLITKIKAERPDVFVLLTTGTLTSAQLMGRRLPAGCVHQFAPADTRKSVRAFLSHWTPDFAIWAESELWPNLIMETRARDIPTALVNARMSANSLEGWQKRTAFARLLLSGFNPILAADDTTAKGISEILERDIPVAGNLKYAAAPLPVNRNEKRKLKAAIGNRPVWAAASTHHGEEVWVARAHTEIRKTHAGALLILAPRHPERAQVIKTVLAEHGFNIAQRSRGDALTAGTDIYLFDTLGELGLVYSLAPVSVVGGSLVSGLSGHNPLEPARLGSAILSGTHTGSFADIYADMIDAGAVKYIKDTPDFARQVSALLTDEATRKRQVKSAKALAKSQDGVLTLVWDALSPHMPDANPSSEPS